MTDQTIITIVTIAVAPASTLLGIWITQKYQYKYLMQKRGEKSLIDFYIQFEKLIITIRKEISQEKDNLNILNSNSYDRFQDILLNNLIYMSTETRIGVNNFIIDANFNTGGKSPDVDSVKLQEQFNKLVHQIYKDHVAICKKLNFEFPPCDYQQDELKSKAELLIDKTKKELIKKTNYRMKDKF